MSTPKSEWLTSLLLCFGGFCLGFICCALLNVSGYADFWPTLLGGSVLHLPVTLAYGSLLVLARHRWPRFIGASSLFLCGIAMGFFPAIGFFPIYFVAPRFIGFVLAIHLLALSAVLVLTFLVTSLMRRRVRSNQALEPTADRADI
jgi:hypothetical protein